MSIYLYNVNNTYLDDLRGVFTNLNYCAFHSVKEQTTVMNECKLKKLL